MIESIYFKVFYCPRRDFAQKAKSRGRTLVTRAYIKESTYSWNTQSHSQYRNNLDLLEQARGREESVGNVHASIVWARKYEMVRMTLWQNIPKGPLRLILWHLLCSHTSSFFCITCYQWHSVEHLFQWKLWTKILTTLVKRRRSYKVHITVYI